MVRRAWDFAMYTLDEEVLDAIEDDGRVIYGVDLYSGEGLGVLSRHASGEVIDI